MPPAFAGQVVGGASAGTPEREPHGRGKPAKRDGTASNRGRRSAKAGDAKPPSRPKVEPTPAAKADRLKAGGLEPIVLDYLAHNADSGPHGPAAVAKAINRSSGAVANCLKRLAASNQAQQVSDKPLRYDKLAA